MTVFAMVEKGRDCGAPQKRCVIPAHRECTARTSFAAATGLCMNEKPPPLEGCNLTSPMPVCRVQAAEPGLDFSRLLVSEAQSQQPSLNNEV